MKKQSSRAKARSIPPVRHQLEHSVPTVIHHPEEDMTALGRLTSHAIQEPRRYLSWPVAIVGVVLLVTIAWRLMRGGAPADVVAWNKLEMASTNADRIAIAKADPGSPPARWALLQAASQYLTDAMRDLPNNHDVSLEASKKALDLYDQIIREAPHDTSPARLAALGRARALEMRNDLPRAIEQYQKVAKEWPDSPEAAEARNYAEALQDPQAARFYKDLYAFEPTTVTLPPGGTATETFPPGIAPSGPLGGQPIAPPPGKSVLPPDMPVPGVREVVVPSSSAPVKAVAPAAKTPAAGNATPAVPATAMPKANTPTPKANTPTPKANTPKPESATPAARPEPPKANPTPKAEPAKAATRPEPAEKADVRKDLPADVFTPPSQTSK